MVFNIVIILLLLYGIYDGYRLGLAHEILRVVGFMFSLLIALFYARDFGQAIFANSNLVNNPLLCNSISFFILFLLAGVLARIIISLVDKITYIPLVHEVNAFGGAVIGFLIAYLSVLFILNVIAVLPNNQIKEQYNQSNVSEFIVHKTPLISHQLFKKWLR